MQEVSLSIAEPIVFLSEYFSSHWENYEMTLSKTCVHKVYIKAVNLVKSLDFQPLK